MSRPKSDNRLYNFLSRSRPGRLPPDSPISARITSRPLSSTTTATNATITPATPKAKMRPIAAISVPKAETILQESQIPSGSATPNPSNTRRKLHNLFGISLQSPKKSSFGSTISQPEPGSSRSSLDVLPLPTLPSTSNSVPGHGRAFSRSHSPPALSNMRQNGTKISTSLTDISNVQCPAPSNVFHRIFSGTKTPQAVDRVTISVSGPIRRPSQHASAKSVGQHPAANKPLYGHEPSASLPGLSMPPPPHIIYTPATPDRKQAAVSPTSPLKTQDPRKISLDSTNRGRPAGVKGKGKEMVQHHPVKGDTAFARHDSDAPDTIQRTKSGGTDSNASEWTRHVQRTGQERDSTFGPGLAGVGTLQREMSLKRGKEWEEQVRARETERRKHFQQQRKQKNEQPSSQDVSTVQTDHTGGSTSTVGTGQSSSWGKAAGKRSALSAKTGSGSGLPKLTTLTHHPAFDFEPPIPSSTSWGTTTAGILHEVSSSSSERPSDAKRHQKTGRSSEGRRPVPVPVSTTIGHRSALKGRSLDLGLGLAWAPSTVREDVLLPSLNVGRSFSQSSSTRSTNGSNNTGGPSSSNGHGKRDAMYAKPEDAEEVSKLGREVATIFKNTLDHNGFVSFKKYVHQFDAHEIPFDGPTGIITRIEQLLGESSSLKPQEKKQLMDQLVRIILRNA